MTKLLRSLSAASAALLLLTLALCPSPVVADDGVDGEPIQSTEEETLQTALPPLGNRAFDLQVTYTSLAKEPQILSDRGTITLALPEGDYPGGKLSRFTAAYSFDKALLTFEATLKPNNNGVLPTAFAVVLTDGTDPVANGQPGIFANMYVDLTTTRPTLSAYAYSGSPSIPSWLRASASVDGADVIVSSDSFPGLLAESVQEKKPDGQVFVRLKVRILDILYHRRRVINPTRQWFGTGFGEHVGVLVSTFVGVQSSYSRLRSTLPVDAINASLGFLTEFAHQGTSIFNFGYVKSCAECMLEGMYFRRQAYWRRLPAYMRPTGMVYLPCQPGTKWYKTTDPVVNEIVRYDPTIPWRNKWQDAFTPHYVSAQLSRLATGKDVSTENKMRSTLWPYNAVEGDIIRLASGSIVTVNSKVQELFDRAEQQKSCTGEEAKQLTALFQKMEETSFQFGAQNIVPQSADDVNYWLSTGTTVKRPDGRRVAQTAKKKAAKKGAKRASKRAAKKK